MSIIVEGGVCQIGPNTTPAPNPWKKWFAWYPVYTPSGEVWLRTVYRAKKVVHGDNRIVMAVEWKYATLLDLLKD
jgi:hypothetical protein